MTQGHLTKFPLLDGTPLQSIRRLLQYACERYHVNGSSRHAHTLTPHDSPLELLVGCGGGLVIVVSNR
eukprot:5034-Eustigmatos_ZCMA.PRE.1